MPKTTAKKTVARQTERYRQAHLTEPVVRPPNAAVRRAVQKRQASGGLSGFVREFPWLSGFLSVAILAGLILTLRANHLTPLFAPKVVPDACAWGTHSSGPASDPTKITRKYSSGPSMCINTKAGNYQANIFTKDGVIVIQLDQTAAPITVNNFVFLATHHFYDGLTFHRVVSNPMVAQAGDPRSINPKADLTQGVTNSPSSPDGAGYVIPDELPSSQQAYRAQAVAMANKGAGTGSSQFFIATGDDSYLPASYSYFGRVTTDTFKYALALKQGDVIKSITITYDPKGIPGTNVGPTPTPGK